MAKSRIKGITIEIDGETVGLQGALKEVNNKSVALQTELKDVQRLLKFDPNNIELVAQKQDLLTQTIQTTTQKLNQLQNAEKEVQAQFKKGDISEEQYRNFQRELQATEQSLKSYKTQLANMDTEQQSVQASTRQLETLFTATKTSVDDYAKALGTRLTNAIKNGAATSRDLDKALSIVGQEALGTKVDIEKLQASLKSVDDGASIKNVRKDLKSLASEAKEAEGAVEGMGISLENVAGALAAGGGLSRVVEKALDVSSLNTKIDVSFNVPESSKKSVEEAVRGVEAYGIESEAALEGVRRQWTLNKDASDEANAKIINGAKTITTAYAGVDFTELIQETNEIAGELNISNEEALALADSLLAAGFPPEQLDTIAEYGKQLQMAGYDAEDIQAIMSAGVDTKSWNIDNLLDGLKEGRIKMAEFGGGVDEATADLLKKTDISKKQFKNWGKSVAKGGEEGNKAMSEVAKALEGVDDETTKNLLGVKIFGTMYEDQGSNITDALINAEDQTFNFGEAIDELGNKNEQLNADPQIAMQQAFQDLLTTLTPLLTKIGEFIGKIAEWIQNNPKLAATLAAIATAVGIVMGVLIALAPIITAVATATGALNIAMAPLIAIVLGVIAGIAALVAVGVLLYQNWDTILAKCKEIWGAIKEFFAVTWQAIKTQVIENWNAVKDFLTTTWNAVKTMFTIVTNAIKTGFTIAWNAIKNFIVNLVIAMKNQITENWNLVKTMFTTITTAIATTLSNIWNGIKNTILTLVTGIKNGVIYLWELIKYGVIRDVNNIKNDLITIWNTIKSVVTTLVTGIKNGVINLFQLLKNGVAEKMRNVKQTIIDIWNQAKSFLQNINLVSIGKNIIQGLINGIKGAAQGVYDAISKIANTIKDKFTGLFDIHSPSRVFYGYGENLDEGLINGIVSMKNDLERAVNNTYGSIGDSARKMSEIEKAKGQPDPSTLDNDDNGNNEPGEKLNAVIELLERLLNKSTDIYIGRKQIGQVIDEELGKRSEKAERGVSYG